MLIRRRVLFGTLPHACTATRRHSSDCSNESDSTPTAPSVTASNERSLLRHLIPLRVQGSGPMSTLLRHAFLQQRALIPIVLGALEHVRLPALPRLLLAEGFQQLLEGRVPQRALREVFEEADVESRRVLLGLNTDAKGRPVLDGRFHSSDGHGIRAVDAESEAYQAVQTDAMRRLLMYQLRGAAGYYAMLMAVSSEPEVSAAVLLRTLIASDIRLDAVLGRVFLAFDAWERDPQTGFPTAGAPPITEDMKAVVREMLLLERDAFGPFRFDPRGDNRMIMHCIKLDGVAKTPQSAAILQDATVRAYGNFAVETEDIFGGRWRRYKVSCAPEDSRILDSLPQLETVIAPDSVDANRRMRLVVHYAEPICYRHGASTRRGQSNTGHVETFDLAVENKNRTYWEKFFLDR